MPPLSADRHRIEREVSGAIIAGLGRVSAVGIWPGFDPIGMPLAVAFPSVPATWLINYDPVDGYLAIEPSASRLQRRDGLDERIVANSVAMIAGRLAASIIVDDAAGVDDTIALAAHELFHIHQAGHYPDWGANEASLLTWPWDDTENIARSMQEMTLLAAATAAQSAPTCRELTRWALTARRGRFAGLPTGACAYEDAVELAEGTAHLIEDRTATLLGTRLRDREDVDPTDVRRRCYRTGRD